MDAITVTYEEDKRMHFAAALTVLYRPWRNVLWLALGLAAIFFVVFGIDCAVNGMTESWNATRSLLLLVVVLLGAIAFYFVYSPLHAWLGSLVWSARRKGASERKSVTFSARNIVETTESGEKAHDWIHVKEWSKTRSFWVLRDRTAKGQIVLPRSAIADDEIARILDYRYEMICKSNPIEAERARQRKARSNNRGTGDGHEGK